MSQTQRMNNSQYQRALDPVSEFSESPDRKTNNESPLGVHSNFQKIAMSVTESIATPGSVHGDIESTPRGSLIERKKNALRT